MTKKFYTTTIALAMFVGIFGIIQYVNAHEDPIATGATVGNVSPIITTPPTDSGSHSGSGTGTTDANPNDADGDVTFTVTAHDVNDDNYYLAICTSEAITVGTDAAPTCADANHTWAIVADESSAASDADVTDLTYAIGTNSTAEGLCTSDETCAWHAFVCDKVASGASCFPSASASDQGYAVGTVTFTDVPDDQTQVTIDDIVYEFDTTDGATCGHATPEDVCMDVSTAEDGADAAAILEASHSGLGTDGTTFYARGAVIYVYAEAEGVDGNSIPMTETDDTGGVIALSGTVLAGGDTEDASPFYINHRPVIVSYDFGDTAGSSGLHHATGTVEPGDTLFISAQITDADTVGAQDTASMYVCSTDSFTEGATPACGVTELCKNTGVVIGNEYAECSFTSYTTIPTADDTYTLYVFVVDNHGFKASASATRTFDVEDVAPYLDASHGTVPGSGYQATDSPDPTAGGSAAVDFTFGIKDNNGDGDITNAKGVFFDDSTTSGCSSDENLCYYDTNCSLDSASTPGGAGSKTSKGDDNQRVATCQVTVWFNATAGDWDVAGKATDQADEVTFADASSSLSNPVLQGVDITEGSIAYSTVEIGGTSARQQTTMENAGNQVLDMFIDGTDMSGDPSGTIVAAQQKFYQTDVDFDWDTDGVAGTPTTDVGAWTLVTSAGGTAEDTGCINRNIAVRDGHTETTTDENIWWKIRIPASQTAGSYTGTTTFSTTADSTCSNGKDL